MQRLFPTVASQAKEKHSDWLEAFAVEVNKWKDDTASKASALATEAANKASDFSLMNYSQEKNLDNSFAHGNLQNNLENIVNNHWSNSDSEGLHLKISEYVSPL